MGIFRDAAIRFAFWSRRADREAGARAIAAGDEARDRRSWGDAVMHYRRCLDLRPELAPIWVQYGHALKESGQVGEAEMAYRRAIEIEAHDPDAHVQLGHALKLRGRIDEAVESYAEALRLDPNFAAALEELSGMGHGPAAVRRLIRRLNRRFVAGDFRRLVFCVDCPLEELPLEIRALFVPNPRPGGFPVGVARHAPDFPPWRSVGDGVEFDFEPGDVAILLVPASPSMLRSIRLLQQARGLQAAAIVVNPTSDSLASSSEGPDDAILEWLDTIAHAAVAICASAAAQRSVETLLRRWKRPAPPLCQVRLDALPQDMASMVGMERSALPGRYVVADLRGAAPSDVLVLAEAWNRMADRMGARLVALVDRERTVPAGLADTEEIVDPGERRQIDLLRDALCAVVLAPQRGWPSMVRLALAQGTVPIVAPDPELVEAAGGLGEICMTSGPTELSRRISRLLVDEIYRQGRRDVIFRRASLRPAEAVLAQLGQSVRDELRADLENLDGAVLEDGIANLALDLPYAFGRKSVSMRGLRMGRGGNFLAEGAWRDMDGKAVALSNGRGNLRLATLGEGQDGVTLFLLVSAGAGTTISINSPQGRGTGKVLQQAGAQWLDLPVWPQADTGLVQIDFQCVGQSEGPGGVLHILYGAAGAGSKVNGRFLDMLQAATLARIAG